MHPEMTLVFLTVFTTVGQGMFILLVALQAIIPNLPSRFTIVTALVALVFQFIGMAASFFHLANPSKGWKAILMWKNSWLSKEVITLSAFVGLAVLYLILFIAGVKDIRLHVVGYAGIVASLGFFIASSMVYASIVYIRQWANAFTPTGFFLFGLTAGTIFVLTLLQLLAGNSSEINNEVNEVILNITMLAVVLLVFSLILKIIAYRYNTTSYTSMSVKNAIVMNDQNIKLMDMGTPYEHFNTKEYSHPFTREHNLILKQVVLLIAFIIPLVLLLLTVLGPKGIEHVVLPLTAAASVIMLFGLIIERKLFFIQGNHIQNLYYNNFRKCAVENPLLSKDKGDISKSILKAIG